MLQALGVAAVAGGPVLAVRAAAAEAPREVGAPSVHADDASANHALSFERRHDGDWRSTSAAVPAKALVAVTWNHSSPPPALRLRVRRSGRWHGSEPLAHLHDEPDAGSGEGGPARGSQLMFLRGADRVQVLTGGATAPTGLHLVVLDATTRHADRTVDKRVADRPQVAARPGVPAQPAIITRKDWGADESWRGGPPRYNQTIKQVHVHHTAGGNAYAREDVPAILRAVYRYHTHNLGWNDVGYNFLVDKFGRLWEGRFGGITRPVRGAHTLGFNATSAGISMIGNYETAEPTPAAVAAVVDLAAWKLGLYGRRADGRTDVTSEGSDKFGPGRVVNLPVIDGHRDTNDTACPGSRLYAHLPAIRVAAQRRLGSVGSAQPITVTSPFVLSGVPVVGQALTVSAGAFTPPDAHRTVAWYRGATMVASGTPTYRLTPADVGAVVRALVTLHHDGSTDVTETLPVPVVIAPASTLTVTTSVSARTVTVTATVHPGGSTPATGAVDLTVATQHRHVGLTGGTGRAVFTKVSPGLHLATASYPGSNGVTPTCATTTVVVAQG